MKRTITLLTASLLGMISANAATISWSSETFLTTEGGSFGRDLIAGQFDQTGTQILAENSGGGALATFDGITWAASTTTFSGGNANGFHSDFLVTALGNEATVGVDSADTVSLTGLTSGNTYRIQALVYDGRGNEDGKTVEFDGIDQGQYSNGTFAVTWGPGLLVTGEFVADSSTQDFTIEAFDGVNSIGGHLNALLVHETAVAVPEPSSTALLGLGGIALILRRRK